MKFSITTPIYYVNGIPHVGHAYSTIAADVLARYHRELGDDVFYLTGTDENAQKNVEAAPEPSREAVQKYVDEMSEKWKETWKKLEITNDDFIRTTEDRHVETVNEFWKKVEAKGDIYKGSYEGLYCTGCEAYKTEPELVDGLCPDHKREPEKISEENYFFKLSAYKDKLLDYFEKHPEFIQPKSRRNEVIAYVKDHASDFSISRKSLEWGIPVPGDESQTIYVWFDALINYISANPARWPVDIHLVGKDIIKFHCAYWPAMLMSAGYELPKTIFAHGFFTINGEKISKTIGNVIDPVELSEKYGNDVLRYYLLKDIPFGSDGDFSTERFVERYNKELGNDLGNLLQRTLTMAEKFTDGLVPSSSTSLFSESVKNSWSKYHEQMEKLELHNALETVWELIRSCNALIDEKKPWELAKEGKKEEVDSVIFTLLDTLNEITNMLEPFLPETALKMTTALGYDEGKVNKGEPLFPRIEN